jgi:protease-3
VIHYVPALPRKVLRVEFRIDNNTAQFRSKTDELVTYLIGNRSPGTLSDWLQKQGLVEGIRADSDPVVNGNSGVLAISATLTDKGLANRDEVVAAIFSYLSLLREKGVDKRYFDELARAGSRFPLPVHHPRYGLRGMAGGHHDPRAGGAHAGCGQYCRPV